MTVSQNEFQCEIEFIGLPSFYLYYFNDCNIEENLLYFLGLVCSRTDKSTPFTRRLEKKLST